MIGFALEVKLIRWKCSCKKHENGVCFDIKPHKRETLREAYIGSFGHDVRTIGDAFRKWDRATLSNFDPPEKP